MAKGWAAKAARLMEEQGGELHRLAFALTGEHASAERLVHTGVVKALKSTTQKTSPEELSVFARRGVLAAFLEEGSRAEKGQTDPFLAALDTLDAPHRLCVVMRFYEGLSCVAIARDLDLLPITVRRSLDSALETLGRPLTDLGLTKHELHFGPQHPPTDRLSLGFTHVMGLASTGSPQATETAGLSPVLQAVARQNRRHAVVVAGLSALAVGALGVGGWTAALALAPSATEPEAAPSPQPSGLYGTGVLASDDVLDPSEAWLGGSEAQRLLVCDPMVDDPASGDPGDGGIEVTSVEFEDENDHDRDAPPAALVSGTCTQLQTNAASLSATIIPFDGSTGRNSLTVVITLTNEGADPIAILRDSVGLFFELPWGGLSSLSSSRDVVMYLSGASLDASSLRFAAVPGETVVVLPPGGDLVIVVSGRVLRENSFDGLLDDSGVPMTPDALDQYRRSMSIIGELSEDDPLIPAFRSGEYVPAAGVSVAVAPTDPESAQFVVLWVVRDTATA